MRAIRGEPRATITLSMSRGYEDSAVTRQVLREEVVHPTDPHQFVHIPIDADATRLAARISHLPAALSELGLQVSTGRVVDFRTRENLIQAPAPNAAPLIYPRHMQGGGIVWPVLNARKANALAINVGTSGLLLPTGDYTLVKRFSAKEERRRVTASWFRPSDVPGAVVAFENHINVFHRCGSGIEPDLAAGLAVFLNTSTIDAYVRQFSGHTQINATDLRLLRYPDRDSLLGMGAAAERQGWPATQDAVDALAGAFVAAFEEDAPDAQAA